MQVSSPNPLDELRVQRDRLAGPLTGRRAPSTDSHERIVEALDQLLTACLLDPPAPHAHDPRHRLLDAVLELCRRIPEPDSRDGEGDDHLLDHLILLVDQILAASRTDRAGTAFTRRVSAQRLRVALGPVVKAGRPIRRSCVWSRWPTNSQPAETRASPRVGQRPPGHRRPGSPTSGSRAWAGA